jgi:hypothetical protein
MKLTPPSQAPLVKSLTETPKRLQKTNKISNKDSCAWRKAQIQGEVKMVIPRVGRKNLGAALFTKTGW